MSPAATYTRQNDRQSNRSRSARIGVRRSWLTVIARAAAGAELR